MSQKKRITASLRSGKIDPQKAYQIIEDLQKLNYGLDALVERLTSRLAALEDAPHVGCDLCNWTGHLDEVDVGTGETWRVWCRCSDRAAEALAGL